MCRRGRVIVLQSFVGEHGEEVLSERMGDPGQARFVEGVVEG